MSHPNLRKEQDCLNCGAYVPDRYCSHCGQENIETKAPYHYLIQHFVEDFTHYDGQFFDTFKVLLFRPGLLTEVYLKGKRLLYVSPVKLYIFISFITFFIPPLIGSLVEHRETLSINFEDENGVEGDFAQYIKQELLMIDRKEKNLTFLDQIIYKPLAEKYIELHEKGFNKEQISDRIIESFLHNLPRALFLYLPLFAFIMWFFHNKKVWYYSDHGVFTLYFFSLILLLSMFSIIEGYLNDSIMKTSIGDIWMFVFDIFDYIVVLYLIGYFFLALRKVYQERWSVILIKGSLILVLSTFTFMILLMTMTVFSIKMTH